MTLSHLNLLKTRLHKENLTVDQLMVLRIARVRVRVRVPGKSTTSQNTKKFKTSECKVDNRVDQTGHSRCRQRTLEQMLCPS